MFCSCCRDVQSAGSALELPVGGGEDYKGEESSKSEGHAGADRHMVEANAQGVAEGSPQSPRHGEPEHAAGGTTTAPKTTVSSSGSPREITRTGATFKVTKPEPPPPAPAPLTLQHDDKARRTSAPVAGTLDAGAYLMYDKENDVLYCQWSNQPQPTALAWLKPLVQVPAHKYNVNKGKQILSRDCVKTGKFYQGWVSFIKVTREYPSKLMMLENSGAGGGGGGGDSSSEAPVARIFLLEVPPDKAGVAYAREVNELNKLYDLVNNIKAVAAVPATTTLITPNEQMESKAFLQKGAGVGAALALAG